MERERRRAHARLQEAQSGVMQAGRFRRLATYLASCIPRATVTLLPRVLGPGNKSSGVVMTETNAESSPLPDVAR
jgi:hypothetical protein